MIFTSDYVRSSPFLNRSHAIREPLALFFEKHRPNASKKFQSLSQSLFERPTLEDENQIAVSFRQPIQIMNAHLAKNRLHNLKFELRRNVIERGEVVQRYCENFKIPQREDYLRLINDDNRSRIVVSFHSGDFLYGLASLLCLGGRQRRNLVLSLNKASDACYTNLASGFRELAPGPACELLLENTSSVELAQRLREGNTTLVLFCDIPPGLNKSAKVTFLCRYAWFSIGPAVLALANRVPLLPVINYTAGSSNYLKLGKQIEPELLHTENLESAAHRITQTLVSFFESVLLEHPEQWRFLSLLPRYFAIPE